MCVTCAHWTSFIALAHTKLVALTCIHNCKELQPLGVVTTNSTVIQLNAYIILQSCCFYISYGLLRSAK